MPKTIQFRKEKGEVKNIGYVTDSICRIVGLLTNGSYTITISKDIKKRTLDQNRLMWLWFACIESETGTLKQDVHDYYCSLFLSRTIIVNDVEKQVVTGTSKLSVEQMTDFLNKVQSDVNSEFGIQLPNPDDLVFQAFEQNYKHLLYDR